MLTIDKVVDKGLCCGCGGCEYASDGAIQMVNITHEGLRPEVVDRSNESQWMDKAVAICPGHTLEHTYDRQSPDYIKEVMDGWGPVRAVWEGWSTDDEIRFAGSSGGAATALSLFGLEAGGMGAVLHTGADENEPHLNIPVMSHNRDELMKRTGSRYSPASPVAALGRVLEQEKPSVFIGKPCDVTAVQSAAKLDDKLDEKVGVTIAFFCAGTPSTQGTFAVMDKMGVPNPESLKSFRYRGNGWPGKATAVFEGEDGDEKVSKMTYQQTWRDTLSRYVQWRCRLCVDHTGEFADIAVGDPWYRKPKEGELGSSLILARTERGERYIREAFERGYLHLEERSTKDLNASQETLMRTRGSVWGRKLVCKVMGISPTYKGLPTFTFWMSELTLKQKVQSILGTIKRLNRRRGLR